MQAQPYILEPIMHLKVSVTSQFTGDVISDINKRRGKMFGINPEQLGEETIEAHVLCLLLITQQH